MEPDPHLSDYGWSEQTPHTEAYLLAPLQQLLREFVPPPARQVPPAQRPTVLDLGCGNGALAEELLSWGYDAIGIDPSVSGIDQARQRLPSIPFHQAPADPAALAQLHLTAFDAVVGTEVVEHVYSPRQWASAAYASLKPGGVLICSTPYRGYLKNCALALSGKLPLHRPLGWRPHQVLEPPHPHSPAARGRLPGGVLPRRRPLALAVEVDADRSAQAPFVISPAP